MRSASHRTNGRQLQAWRATAFLTDSYAPWLAFECTPARGFNSIGCRPPLHCWAFGSSYFPNTRTTFLRSAASAKYYTHSIPIYMALIFLWSFNHPYLSILFATYSIFAYIFAYSCFTFIFSW